MRADQKAVKLKREHHTPQVLLVVNNQENIERTLSGGGRRGKRKWEG